ncbi:shikimate dehydrogenase [Microbacterium dextranolyticum]|uniref:Shikimate dehydrogenase n=1 Tax=Microbacterium dextranolyticum TaxID=36806 RepID=A0A9W6M6G5_9MICO|nr:shikimate dehydrogenase [Microbacterium dextranolyticum]MBM7463044.1 shikimate dehydrogenase [Microbacterium dextranolyticum]GLJ95851.1 shikimate dehydrogenase [Microbacterium dextranolyticum]
MSSSTAAGRPYLVGLVGTGVTPSLTPPMHMAEAAALGLDYVYRPIDLTTLSLSPDAIGEVLTWAERLGYDALNITHPCKQTVIAHLDAVDPLAAALGAVNTVLLTPSGRIGYNTDTTGFAAGFLTGLPDVRTDRVVQLGAGGAGSAVGDALLRVGVTELSIVDVDPDRAARLAADLCARHGGSRARAASSTDLARLLAAADGLVHCTPTGMAEHPGLPLPADLLHADLWVADIVYRPFDTALLAAARARGCRTLDGGRMAVHQAVDAFELITGERPDADRMTAHFHRLVDADHDVLAR